MSGTGTSRRLPPIAWRRGQLAAQEGRCYWCDCVIGEHIRRQTRKRRTWTKLRLHWDHVEPFAYAQNNQEHNFVAACHVCNGIKGSSMHGGEQELRAHIDARRAELGYLWFGSVADREESKPRGVAHPVRRSLARHRGVSMSDDAIRLVIEGRPISKKNSRAIVTIKGKPRVIASKAYRAWQESAVTQLRNQWTTAPITDPITATILVYYLGKRPDLSNAVQGPEDAMQAAGIIVDDAQIESLDGSRVIHDKARPRVEITITRYA